MQNVCRFTENPYLCNRKRKNAEIAQLVEHNLAKVRVAGSSPVFRSQEGIQNVLDTLFNYTDMALKFISTDQRKHGITRITTKFWV